MVSEIDRAALVEEVQASQSHLTELEAKRDMEGVLEFFSDDVVIHSDGQPALSGKQALREFYEWGFGLPFTGFAAGSSETFVADSGDLAYDLGWMDLTFDQEGFPPLMQFKFTCILRKLDGVWKIVVNILTTNAPASS